MKSISDLFEYLLFMGFGVSLRLLPLKSAVKIGGSLGTLLYFIDFKHRKIAFDNLKESFKDSSNSKIKRITKSVFKNIGKSFVEFLFLPKFSREGLLNLVKIEGEENLNKALSKGKGVIVIVPHFGNWELIGATYPTFGPSWAVAFPQSNKLTDAVINRYRTSTGLKILYTGEAIKEIIRLLKRNEIIGLLADQDAGADGVFVDFFGRAASTNKGPVVLALKTKAAIIMTFIIREKDDTHRFVIEEELKLIETGDFEEDVKVNTARWSKILEDYVRKYPDHWFWVHRRWKSQLGS